MIRLMPVFRNLELSSIINEVQLKSTGLKKTASRNFKVRSRKQELGLPERKLKLRLTKKFDAVFPLVNRGTVPIL